MWGAATHDRATGVHRPLEAALLWLEPESGDVSQAIVIVSLDHCILDGSDIELMQQRVALAGSMEPQQVLISLTHTHAAGLMSRSRADQPGGELIGPYLDDVAHKLAELTAKAAGSRQRATILYGKAHCNLAANRDLYVSEAKQFVCGFNPDGPADDTVVVAKINADDGLRLASIVNYACHPTTLAWQNTRISPDYVGLLRDKIFREFGAPCLFLQGASADLGPREGFVGDSGIADRNGRTLAYVALSALNSLPSSCTRFVYSGSVLSGATIGTWQHEPLDAIAIQRTALWHVAHGTVQLEYRPDLPTVDQTRQELEYWQREEAAAVAAGRSDRTAHCRARVERTQRQLWRLTALPPNHFPLPLGLARLGDAIWLFIAGEHYQSLQTSLRARFPRHPIIVATITNGWQPGYIPPADVYGRGIYQEQIAVVAAGSSERLQESIFARIEQLIQNG